VITLGFDTSTRATAVGLRLPDGRTLHARDDPGSDERPGHATRLLAMADELLAEAEIPWAALERIAVGLGPGRFTGLRVGVATARGLAQSLAVALVGVSTLRALASPALAAAGESERVVAVIDALRGEVFAAGYGATAGEAALAGLEFPRPLRADELGGALPRTGAVGALAVGDGALRYRAQLEAAGARVPDEESPLHLVQGAAICELGVRAAPREGYEWLVPDYRRRADAEGVRGAVGSGRSRGELQGAQR
jgi:tRNA threonylcarbamoyladenosine biosynthesis protein TsaB